MSFIRNRSSGRPWFLGLAALAAFGIYLGLVGCSATKTATRKVSGPGTAKLQLKCVGEAPDGWKIEIDMIFVNDAEAQQINLEGDNWFYSKAREQLEQRRHTLTRNQNCRDDVELKAVKGYKILAIIAGFPKPEAGSSVSMKLLTEDDWRGKPSDVLVYEKRLEVTKR